MEHNIYNTVCAEKGGQPEEIPMNLVSEQNEEETIWGEGKPRAVGGPTAHGTFRGFTM